MTDRANCMIPRNRIISFTFTFTFTNGSVFLRAWMNELHALSPTFFNHLCVFIYESEWISIFLLKLSKEFASFLNVKVFFFSPYNSSCFCFFSFFPHFFNLLIEWSIELFHLEMPQIIININLTLVVPKLYIMNDFV